MAKITQPKTILAFDTSMTACSVALQHGQQLKFLHQIAPMQQAKQILPFIQTLLNEFSLSCNDLDVIAYGAGPGSFTGIRIANSVAQGIAMAANKPIIRISSLAILAQTVATEHQCTKMLLALDARMGQIYWASYVLNNDGYVELIGEEQLCTPENVRVPEHQEWDGVGDGWTPHAEVLIQKIGFKPAQLYTNQIATAQALLQLAKVGIEQNDYLSAAEAMPIYLR